jgi:hypothetical protein
MRVIIGKRYEMKKLHLVVIHTIRKIKNVFWDDLEASIGWWRFEEPAVNE